jgi:hypothetical protein
MPYEIAFYRLKTNRMKMAVTPAPDAHIFPNPNEWEFNFSPIAHPEQTVDELRHWETMTVFEVVDAGVTKAAARHPGIAICGKLQGAMIKATQRKLREARFFYQHLATERGHRNANPEGFRFYFSAFIGAARSVTWVMRSEEPEKYAAWEPRWKAQLSPEDQKLEKLTNDMRLDEVKRLGADVFAEVEVIDVIEIFEEAGFKIAGNPATTGLKTSRPRLFFEHAEGKTDLAALCKRYLSYLERKVDSFLAAHAASS